MQRRGTNVRLSVLERRKVERLAELTGSTLSDVVRRLIAQARVEGVPDVHLTETTQENSRTSVTL